MPKQNRNCINSGELLFFYNDALIQSISVNVEKDNIVDLAEVYKKAKFHYPWQNYHMPDKIIIMKTQKNEIAMRWYVPENNMFLAYAANQLLQLTNSYYQYFPLQVLLIPDESDDNEVSNAKKNKSQIIPITDVDIADTDESEEYDSLPWKNIIMPTEKCDENNSSEISRIDQQIKSLQQLCRETNAQLVAIHRETQAKPYKQLVERVGELDKMLYYMRNHLRKGQFFENLQVYRKRMSSTLREFGIEEIVPLRGQPFDPERHVNNSGSGKAGETILDCILPGFQMIPANETEAEILLEALVSVH